MEGLRRTVTFTKRTREATPTPFAVASSMPIPLLSNSERLTAKRTSERVIVACLWLNS